MKKLYTFTAILITFLSFAQVPQGISYQAIALDASGNPVVSANVGIRLSILDATATGAVLYSESHIKTTNPQGLFNLVIGQGTNIFGTFASIKWETNSKFLKVEMDAAGGTNYVLVGTTELLSVPYALMAGKVKSEDLVGGPDAFADFYAPSFMTSTNAYVYQIDNVTETSNWNSTPISGIPLMKSGNSFLTSTNAYFLPVSTNVVNSPSWESYPVAGEPLKIINDYSNNFFGVITTTNAYVRYSLFEIGQWVPTNISGNFVDFVKNPLGFGILTTTNAYVFKQGIWSSIQISGSAIKLKSTISGVMIITSNNAYVYNGVWNTIPISGTLLLD